MTSKQLAKVMAKAADDIQAEDIIVLDLTLLTSFTDYFLICSGKSTTQVKAIAETMMRHGKSKGRKSLGLEGYAEGEWVLVDFGDVVAHVFYHEMREHYHLEKLWGDAPQLKVK